MVEISMTQTGCRTLRSGGVADGRGRGRVRSARPGSDRQTPMSQTNSYQLLDAQSHHRAQMANVTGSMPGNQQYFGLLHRFSAPETLLGRSGTRFTVRRCFSLRSLESPGRGSRSGIGLEIQGAYLEEHQSGRSIQIAGATAEFAIDACLVIRGRSKMRAGEQKIVQAARKVLSQNDIRVESAW